MTESIQSILTQISEKAKGLHRLLLKERQRTADLATKNDQLQAEIDEKSAALKEMEAKLMEQEERLANVTQQKSDSVVAPSLGRTQEIDELVKEIEYCIGQLRK